MGRGRSLPSRPDLDVQEVPVPALELHVQVHTEQKVVDVPLRYNRNLVQVLGSSSR